jgi:peptidoglycan/xylan/chitin deacetylase (PgdA/CDA1 family)
MGVWGAIGEKKFGLPQIIEMCDRHGLKATFFVDAYQHPAEMEKACHFILRRGHEIQLHTHPNWHYDRKRENLQKYSFEEQCEIIAYGIKKLREWTGTAPVAHRAGDFGANENTLKALAQNQIQADFSYFWRWKDCDLNQQFELKNQLARIHSVLEIPTTCFHSPGFGFSKTFRLIDIYEPFSLLKKVLAEMLRLDYRTMVVVLHSFSLIQWNNFPYKNFPTRRIYWPQHSNIRKLDHFLRLLHREHAVQVVTVTEYLSCCRNPVAQLNNPTEIPRVGLPNTLNRISRSIGKWFVNRFYHLPRNCPVSGVDFSERSHSVF